MARNARIRASDLAEYVYCEQAWWLRRQGYAPRHRARLAEGLAYHQAHLRGVRRWLTLRRWAQGLLVLALVLFLMAGLVRVLG